MKNILISFIFIIIANLPVIAFSSQIKDENTILFINQYDYSGPISASVNKEK